MPGLDKPIDLQYSYAMTSRLGMWLPGKDKWISYDWSGSYENFSWHPSTNYNGDIFISQEKYVDHLVKFSVKMQTSVYTLGDE